MHDPRRVKGRGAYGFIESKWVFNAKRGSSRRRLTRQVYYHVYGDKQRNPSQTPRGFVYDQGGDVVRYGDYKSWALGQSRRQNYVFRTHVSPQGHVLSDQDFVAAIRAASEKVELFNEFRLVVHRDTPNAHAHMLFASQRQWRRSELAAWKIALRKELMARERIRCAELGVPLPGTMHEQGRGNSAEKPTRRPTKRRRRRRNRKPTRRTKRRTVTSSHDDRMTLG